MKSWDDVAVWYADLASDRRRTTPEIAQKVKALTASAPTWMDKVKALAAFVQTDIRYVAIEVGIGGYQPHPAAEVFANRYGDCKDKATLLSVMLNEVGVKSYYVLVQTKRGVVTPEVPNVYFDHVIVGLPVPDGTDVGAMAEALVHDEKLGTLLLFDPTDTHTPLGKLPPAEQLNYCLVVYEAGGRLVKTPVAKATDNRFLREGRLNLSADGTLSGEITELRMGTVAIEMKTKLLAARGPERLKLIESVVSASISGFDVRNAKVEGLDSADAILTIRYGLRVPGYAQTAGNLLLVRPRVLGVKGEDLLEDQDRKCAIELRYTAVQGDSYQITLPPGYTVDELPAPVDLQSALGTYKSQSEVKDGVLTYRRVFEENQLQVPVAKLDGVKTFYRQLATDEQSLAILKAATP